MMNLYDEPDDQQDALQGEPKTKPEAKDATYVPRTALQGKEVKVGDQITVKVVRVLDDEVALSFAASQTESPEEEEAEPTAEPEDEGQMKAGEALYD